MVRIVMNTLKIQRESHSALPTCLHGYVLQIAVSLVVNCVRRKVTTVIVARYARFLDKVDHFSKNVEELQSSFLYWPFWHLLVQHCIVFFKVMALE